MQGKYMYIEGVLGTTYSPASLRSSGFRIGEAQPVLTSMHTLPFKCFLQIKEKFYFVENAQIVKNLNKFSLNKQ